MTKNIITLLFISISIISFSQHASLKGIVKNEVENTTVSNTAIILDGKLNTNTDAKGKYQFFDVAMGEHKISVVLLGYETKEIIINLQRLDLPT